MKTMVSRTMMAAALTIVATAVRGGNLDSPTAPTSPGSAMVTLDDVYNKLNDRSTVVAKRTGTFAEPAAGPGATGHTLDQVMLLVTNRAAVRKSGQTTSYATGDDGDLELGVRWPVPRFTIGTTGAATNCVTDNLTGLMWTRKVNLGKPYISADGKCSWFNAINVITNPAGPVNGASYGGHSDWRMPNANELRSLVDYGRANPALCNTQGAGGWADADPFFADSTEKGGGVWTSSQYMYSDRAWYVPLPHGGLRVAYTSTGLNYVWAVRGGGN